MKRKILIVSILAICIAILAVGTLAYFTAEDTAHNVITSGGVNIQLVEKTIGDDGTQIDFPKEGLSGIMPGMDASKIVSVENTGGNSAWIRVKVETRIYSNAGDKEELETKIPGKDGMVDVISFQIGEGWKRNENDGYYYYQTAVEPKESTGILFETVHFAEEMGNEYQNCTAELIISAEAVQTANNGETVDEALGWPGSHVNGEE